ncbi:MAG: hypothetical protein MZU97_25645 [Bacillus subtilis]|nr:hypothetical protein [Bacillus subtilis]
MNELTNKFWPAVKYLALPYLLLLFLLFFPIDYQVTAPGGLTDVDLLIEIETDQPNPIAGSFSTTYVVSIPRMTFFQFIISYFSPQTDVYALAGDNLNYTNNEIQQISYLDKATSVQASVIVAYQAAQAANPNVAIGVVEKVLVFGKATFLSHYRRHRVWRRIRTDGWRQWRHRDRLRKHRREQHVVDQLRFHVPQRSGINLHGNLDQRRGEQSVRIDAEAILSRRYGSHVADICREALVRWRAVRRIASSALHL